MNERVVERVARDCGGLVVRVAVAKTRRIVVHPGDHTPELMHMPYKMVFDNVGNTVIHMPGETGNAVS
ncbi:hypothetical protein SDC9_198823 [bioreactor metagenome]|uniref:Uncharacterized protein n=1 Tax=bioreactor metagenome TaxID=1076179 RepID=A0A645IIR6_9ZZZZ